MHFMPELFAKAYCPMVVTPSGIVSEVSFIQWEKANSPIIVTLLGIVTEDKFVHSSKA